MKKKAFTISATQEEYDNIHKRCNKLEQTGVNFSSVCIKGANMLLIESEENSYYAKNIIELEKAKKELIEVGLLIAETPLKELNSINLKELKQKVYRKALTFRKLN